MKIPPVSGLTCRLREFRERTGLSQQALAARAGVTRQAVNALEGGRYAPNMQLALQLANILDCGVESLYALAEEKMPALTPAPVRLAARASQGMGLQLGRVRGRMVAWPLGEQRLAVEGFAAADGWLRGRRAELAGPVVADGVALLLGCDPALGILRELVQRVDAAAAIRWISVSSRAALAALGRGEAHAAGTHLTRGGDEKFRLRLAEKSLARTGGLVVAFAQWEEGLMAAAGNPRSIRGVADLARREIRLINREPGAGSRASLDERLAQSGIPANRVTGYDTRVHGQLAAARAVADGRADVAVGSGAAAKAFNLHFVPLAATRFDLVIPADLLAVPTVARMIEVCQGRALRAELSRLPGYETRETGRIVARIPAPGRAGRRFE